MCADVAALQKIRGNKYLRQTENLILDFMKNENARIFLFGSWARGAARHSSDVDIAVEYADVADEKKNRRFAGNVGRIDNPLQRRCGERQFCRRRIMRKH